MKGNYDFEPLPDGKVGIFCETVELFRWGLERSVRNDVAIKRRGDDMTDYRVEELEAEMRDGKAYVTARFGFPDRMRTLRFVIPQYALVDEHKALHAQEKIPAPEPKEEAEINLPEGWRFATDAEVEAHHARAEAGQ